VAQESGARQLEDGIQQDFRQAMSYGDYLHLDEILGAQHPISQPPQHDEMLFIIQHQTSELWLKLMLHELRSARQWSVLATLTPSEYAEFRAFLATSSGFQSFQYRAVEFILGNKQRDMIPVFGHDPANQQMLQQLLMEPSLYDEFLRYLARRGYAIPPGRLERDWTEPYRLDPDLVPVLKDIYEHSHEHWGVYETCEELVDLEDNFQFWRFRHLRTVERIIGSKPGTGGSSGVPFLRQALELTFFPELYAVRGEISEVSPS
jgi:tryptophan 2,3-dioxygenase